MDNIISFEVAKLAKVKGFNIYTRNAYQSNGLKSWYNPSSYNGKGEPQGYKYWNFESNYYAAPTQTGLQAWLRDKHQCYVTITQDFYLTGINFCVQVLFYDVNGCECYGDKSSGKYGDNGEFKTYESALEFGLEKALNLI